MLFEKIDVLLPQGVCREQWVGIRGERIAYLGAEPPQADFGRRIDGRGKLLLPGFVNAHAHTPMVLMRGYGENMTLSDWLENRIFPFEAHIAPQDAYWATLLGIAEMARYGITSTTDMYYHLPQMAQAYLEAGMKVNLCNSALCFDDTPYQQQRSYQDTVALLDLVGEKNDLVRVDIGLHAEYTSSEQTARAVAEDAVRRGLRMQVHLSETKKEHDEGKQRRKRTPARYLADCGIFDQPTTAAHCVWLEPDDFDLLREKGVTIATCPKSNLKLGSGVFNLRLALDKKVSLALGTDSVASNNNLNMLEELRTLLLIQKGVSGDPTLLTPLEGFHAATRAGALSQGREDCGEIAEGMRADLCVLDLSKPWNQPVIDPLNNAAYTASGSEVVMTLVNGRVLYDDGRFPTLDVERAVWETERARQRILGEIEGQRQ